ncbi:Mitochondrial holo-[acyl-carrier-protein] synthase [Nakaseomyces bracarensis]|uniref:Mitochondrial holo-[acyl-carrier-protein] synthase n=1 Tax=Nakaseomyces bracarensis TaxID=273131 RepID=A0ABR4NU79_9SACH
MIAGVGCDIVYLPRVARLLARYPRGTTGFQRLVTKFMHEEEIRRLGDYSDAQLLTKVAGTWALKEAGYKALFSAVDHMAVCPPEQVPSAMRVYTRLLYRTRTAVGSPRLNIDSASLSGEPFDEFLSRCEYLASISHDSDYVVAYTTLIKHN